MPAATPVAASMAEAPCAVVADSTVADTLEAGSTAEAVATVEADTVVDAANRH